MEPLTSAINQTQVQFTNSGCNTEPSINKSSPAFTLCNGHRHIRESTSGERAPRLKSKLSHQCTADYWQVGAVVACFFANFMSGGIVRSYGVLYIYMQEPLGVSEYQLSWIGSLMTGFLGIASILATILIDSRGCRITTLVGPVLVAVGLIISSQTSNIFVLYFTLGGLTGVGISLSYNATMVHVNRQFTKWRPMAVGISVAGSAVGMLTFPPLTSGLAQMMGWRGVLLIQTGITLHLVPCALWIKPGCEKENSLESSNKSSDLQCLINYLHIFKQKGVVLVTMTHIFIGLSYNIFSIFIPLFVTTSNLALPKTDAAFIISIAGFGSLAGRILCAGVSLLHPKAPQVIFTIALCICGLLNLTVPLIEDRDIFLVNGAFYGLALGAWPSVASLVFVNLFGLENLSKTLGTFMFAQGVGSFCGAPLQSYISELLSNQELIFYSNGVLYILSAVCVLPMLVGRSIIPSSRKSLDISVVGIGNDGFISD